MKLLLLISTIFLICIGGGILLFFSAKNKYANPVLWKLSKKDKGIALLASVSVITGILIQWIYGYM